MTIDLKTIYQQGATSTLLQNPVTSQLDALQSTTSGLNDLSKLGSIKQGLDAVAALKTQASDYVTQSLEALKTKLPLMSAASTLEQKMKVLDGVAPGTGASTSFSASMSGLTSIKDKLQSVTSSINSTMTSLTSGLGGGDVKAKLNSLAAQAPSPTIPDPNNPSQTITNPAYTTFVSANSAEFSAMNSAGQSALSSAISSASSITAAAQAEAAQVASGVTKLKDMAFADFLSRPHPPEVKNLIGQFVAPLPTSVRVEKDIINSAKVGSESNSNVPVTGTSATPLTSVAPLLKENLQEAPYPATDTTAITPQLLAQMKDALKVNGAVIDSMNSEIESRKAVLQAWKDSVGYDGVKQQSVDNPENAEYKAAYESLRAQL